MDALEAAVFAGTFVAVIVRQMLGRGPGLWVLLLAGGLLTVAIGGLSPAAAGQTLWGNLPVFGFLAALFLFVGALDVGGAFDHLARWFLGRARTPSDLPLVLFLGFGVLAGFLLNDALVLIGVPLVFAIAKRLEAPVRPLLYTVAFSVTIGSVLTPMGNPQNLLVALGSGIRDPVTTFLRYLAVPTAINLVVGALYVRWVFRSSFVPLGGTHRARFPPIPLVPPGGWAARLRRAPALLVFPATTLAMIGADVLGSVTGLASPPIYLVAIIGAILLVAISPGRLGLVRRIDGTILLLFAGLFLLVAGAQSAGLLASVESVLPIPGPGVPGPAAMLAVVGSSLLGPQVVSNVPWVGLQISNLHALGYGGSAPIVWVALAAGSTLAGNATLLGAASNLIVAERAEAQLVRFRLGPFVRLGLPLTALTVAVLIGCLLLGI